MTIALPQWEPLLFRGEGVVAAFLGTFLAVEKSASPAVRKPQSPNTNQTIKYPPKQTPL